MNWISKIHYTYTSIYQYLSLSLYIHMYIYIHINICMYVCMHVCMYVWMHACMHVCNICMYVCMHACNLLIYVCIPTYIYAYTHADVYIYIYTMFVNVYQYIPSVCINAEPHGTALVSQKSSSAIAAMSFFVRRKRGRSSRTVVMSF